MQIFIKYHQFALLIKDTDNLDFLSSIVLWPHFKMS